MKRYILKAALAVVMGVGLTGHATAAERPTRTPANLTLPAPTPDAVREQALAWLKTVDKDDPATREQFDVIWANGTRAMADLVADTLALGDGDAAKLLVQARDPQAPAPTDVPSLLLDGKRPVFFRANLALAYGKALASRGVFEEALAALKLSRPTDVADPAAYHFHRAVAEHGLGLRAEAARSLNAVRNDLDDVPVRYQRVADVMEQEMQAWRERDLGDAARKMKNVGRRLDLARGGPTTQKMQREVVAILDDIIKEMERDPKDPEPPGPPGPSPRCPNNPAPPGPRPPVTGEGKVDDAILKGLARQWGKLPPAERAAAMAALARDLPPEYRDIIERYFKRLAQAEMSEK